MIDPVTEEEGCEDGSFMMTCMPSRYEITQLTVTGEWTTPNINEVCLLINVFGPFLFSLRYPTLSLFRFVTRLETKVYIS